MLSVLQFLNSLQSLSNGLEWVLSGLFDLSLFLFGVDCFGFSFLLQFFLLVFEAAPSLRFFLFVVSSFSFLLLPAFLLFLLSLFFWLFFTLVLLFVFLLILLLFFFLVLFGLCRYCLLDIAFLLRLAGR